MSPEMRRAKLRTLCETEGYEDENDLFASAMTDSVCPAICCNPDNPECDYTEEKEPDSRDGWCEECQRGTMVSALVLGGSSDALLRNRREAIRVEGHPPKSAGSNSSDPASRSRLSLNSKRTHVHRRSAPQPGGIWSRRSLTETRDERPFCPARCAGLLFSRETFGGYRAGWLMDGFSKPRYMSTHRFQ
jgi:hypothetical protein